ncbi:MAG: GNAT family N-acetyltransferase, partial [Bacteroidota bacterium]
MCQYTRNLELLYETPPEAPKSFTPQRDVAWHILRNALIANRKYLLEHEAKELLACYGLPVAKPLVATSAHEAGRFAEQTGFPVVLKIISPDALHKTEVGGVKLNIWTKEDAEKAFGEIVASLKNHKPDAQVVGVLVEKMVKKRYELLLGAKRDPVFGPLIAFGQGGVAVEILKDTSLALPPLNMALAHHLIHGTKIYELLKGFRGIPGVDLDDLAFQLCKFSQIMVDFPEIQEIDINPFLFDETGGMAVDARILLDEFHPRRKGHPYDHLVISPYPEKYSKKVLLRNGTTALLRPIRPEDEPAEVEMLKSVSDQSLYFRFFGYVPHFTHDLLTRFTHIDYDREMALIALVEEEGATKIAGVVRIISDAWGETAEFAILVADPWQNQGLGTQLTDYILEIARDKGIRKIYASVLSANQRMLKMFQDRGFQVKLEGQDGYTIELDLESEMPFVTELPFQPA